jgi:hypothetical protein
MAHLLAPVGREFSLGKAILAVFLMNVEAYFSPILLKPYIGSWVLAVDLLFSIWVIYRQFQLTFARSCVAALVYWSALIAAVYFICIRPAKIKAAEHMPVAVHVDSAPH